MLTAGFRRETIPLSIIIGETGGQRNFKLTCIEEILLTAMPAAVENTVKQDKNAVVPGSEKVSVSHIHLCTSAPIPVHPVARMRRQDSMLSVVHSLIGVQLSA